MKAITTGELLALLNSVRGATFATIITKTDARLRKTGNPHGPVFKVSRVNVTLGFQYEAAVNRQLAREGAPVEFEAKPRQWGEKVSPMLVSHKGKMYLEAKVERSLGYSYQTATGKELTDADVKQFLPERSKSRQGTEKEVLVRDYSLDSIQGISFKGEDFILLK